MTTPRFTGFPNEALAFYGALEADNSRTFWKAHKPQYDTSVRAPMEALLAQVDDEFGPFHIFRPYVDVRFSKNKAPYKTHIGAYSESEAGAGFYVQFSGSGLLAASGYYAMAPDQLDRFRRAVDDDARGAEIAALVAAASRRRIGRFLHRCHQRAEDRARGYPKDHPRIELIRRKGLMGSRSWEPGAWLHTAKVIDRVVAAWRDFAPVNNWLDTHVGPSTLPPDDAEGF